MEKKREERWLDDSVALARRVLHDDSWRGEGPYYRIGQLKETIRILIERIEALNSPKTGNQGKEKDNGN